MCIPPYLKAAPSIDPRTLHRTSNGVPCQHLNELFNEIVQKNSRSSYFNFLKTARVLHLNIEVYKKYLEALEQANFLTQEEKNRQLFLYACEENNFDSAKKYVYGNFDHLALFFELGASQNHSMAIKVLASKINSIDLPLEYAVVPNIFLLLEHKVIFKIKNKSVVEWGVEENCDYIIEFIKLSRFIVTPEFLTKPALKSYFAGRYNIGLDKVSYSFMYQQLENWGAQFFNQLLFFKLACQEDDVDFANHLLNGKIDIFTPAGVPQYFGVHNLLTYACSNFPVGLRVVDLLISKGLALNQVTYEQKLPLQCAIEANNVVLTYHLLTRYESSLFYGDLYNQTPFVLLMTSPNPQMRGILLDPYFKQQYGKWPLEYWVPLLKKIETPTSELQVFLEHLVPCYSSQQLLQTHGQELLAEVRRFNIQSIVGYLEQLFLQSQSETSVLDLMEKGNSSMTKFLIENQLLDANARPGGIPLVFFAVEKMDQELYDALQRYGANIYALNQRGYGVIHELTLSQNVICLRWLLQRNYDVNVLDQNQRSALYHALPNNGALIDLLMRFGAHPFHLGERLKDYLKYYQGEKLTQLIGAFSCCREFLASGQKDFWTYIKNNMHTLPKQEILEICFLFPVLSLEPQRAFNSREEYVKALLELRKKYPQAPLEYFYQFLLGVNPQHYKNFKNAKLDTKIPHCRKNVELNRLIGLFEGINWTNPLQPGYVNPNAIRIKEEHKTVTKQGLIDAYRNLVDIYIPRQEILSGIPQDPVKRDAWYKDLRNNLKQVILLLETEQDVEKKTKYLIKLFASFTVCGTAWSEKSALIYNKLTVGKKAKTLENEFIRFLGNSRHGIVVSLNTFKDNQHQVRQYLRLMGKDYAIAQTESIPDMDDGTEDPALTYETCQWNFEYAYAPANIIKLTENFFELAYQDQLNSALMKWFKLKMPQEYTTPALREFEWALKCTQLFSPGIISDENIRNLLVAKGINVEEDKSFEAIISSHKFVDFWNNHVRVLKDNAYVTKTEAIVFFLLQFNVLGESFEGIFNQFLLEWEKSSPS